MRFMTAHIWACPPSKGDDYIFHCHPPEQKIPESKRLSDWCRKMLDTAKDMNVIYDYKDIFKYCTDEGIAMITELPYFEGDFWPNVMEEFIKELDQEAKERDASEVSMEGGPKKVPNKATKKGGVSLGVDDLSSKVYLTMKNHKDVFFTVLLQPPSADTTPLPKTTDPDQLITCNLMDGRNTFFTMSRERHWEFCSLRRAKFSSISMVYELYTQGNKFMYNCNSCHLDVVARYHCTECDDFDLCIKCYKEVGHNHEMVRLGLSIDDPQSNLSRQLDPQKARQASVQKCIQALVHANQCRHPHCERPSCIKMKRVLTHTRECILMQSGKWNHCMICKQFVLLCISHAKICTDDPCRVPLCAKFRKNLEEQRNQRAAGGEEPLISQYISEEPEPPTEYGEVETEDKDWKPQFDEAMEAGRVEVNTIPVLLMGPAGSGKTTLKKLLCNQVIEEDKRTSTTCLDGAVVRPVETFCFQTKSDSTSSSEASKWELVESKDVITMLAQKIRAVNETSLNDITEASQNNSINVSPDMSTPINNNTKASHNDSIILSLDTDTPLNDNTEASQNDSINVSLDNDTPLSDNTKIFSINDMNPPLNDNPEASQNDSINLSLDMDSTLNNNTKASQNDSINESLDAETPLNGNTQVSSDSIPESSNEHITSGPTPVDTVYAATNPTSHGDNEDTTANSDVRHAIDAVIARVKSASLGDVDIECKDRKLFTTLTIRLTDTGGQQQFHDIAPLFTQQASVGLFVSRIIDDLDSFPCDEFYVEGVCVGQASASHLSHRETLQSLLRAFASRSTQKQKYIFIGTHRDEVEKQIATNQCQFRDINELLDYRNKQLLQIIPQDLKKSIFSKNEKFKHLIIDIDAKNLQNTKTQRTAKLIRARVEKSVPLKVPVPLRWFILELSLQELCSKLGRGVLTKSECSSIAERIGGVTDPGKLDAALKYFNDVYIAHYYPEILSNLVFVDPQIPLDILSMLTKKAIELRNPGKLDQSQSDLPIEMKWEDFKERGIFTRSMLQELAEEESRTPAARGKKHFYEGIFSSEDMIEIMKKLLIVATLKEKTSDSEAEFFMPSLLTSLPPSQLRKILEKNSTASSLIIQSNEKCIKHGAFCCLIVFLMKHCLWIIPPKKDVVIARNCIQFKHPHYPGTVTLIDSYPNIKIHYNVTNLIRCQKACPKIKQNILDGIKDAYKTLRYKEPKLKLCIASPCDCECTLAEIKEESDDWQCCEDPDHFGTLQSKHYVWLNKEPVETNLQYPATYHTNQQYHLNQCGFIVPLHVQPVAPQPLPSHPSQLFDPLTSGYRQPKQDPIMSSTPTDQINIQDLHQSAWGNREIQQARLEHRQYQHHHQEHSQTRPLQEFSYTSGYRQPQPAPIMNSVWVASREIQQASHHNQSQEQSHTRPLLECSEPASGVQRPLLLDEVINNLDQVYGKVFRALNEWHNLGLALGVDHNILISIKRDHHNTSDCLREMLTHRLKTPNLTWRVLCTALRKDTVGRHDIADEIETESHANKDKTIQPEHNRPTISGDSADLGPSPTKYPRDQHY